MFTTKDEKRIHNRLHDMAYHPDCPVCVSTVLRTFDVSAFDTRTLCFDEATIQALEAWEANAREYTNTQSGIAQFELRYSSASSAESR